MTLEKDLPEDMSVYDLARLMSGYATRTEERFDQLEMNMNGRFDRIENIVLPKYERRIEKLEDESRHVRTYLKLA